MSSLKTKKLSFLLPVAIVFRKKTKITEINVFCALVVLSLTF